MSLSETFDTFLSFPGDVGAGGLEAREACGSVVPQAFLPQCCPPPHACLLSLRHLGRCPPPCTFPWLPPHPTEHPRHTGQTCNPQLPLHPCCPLPTWWPLTSRARPHSLLLLSPLLRPRLPQLSGTGREVWGGRLQVRAPPWPRQSSAGRAGRRPLTLRKPRARLWWPCREGCSASRLPARGLPARSCGPGVGGDPAPTPRLSTVGSPPPSFSGADPAGT